LPFYVLTFISHSLELYFLTLAVSILIFTSVPLLLFYLYFFIPYTVLARTRTTA